MKAKAVTLSASKTYNVDSFYSNDVDTNRIVLKYCNIGNLSFKTVFPRFKIKIREYLVLKLFSKLTEVKYNYNNHRTTYIFEENYKISL